jgi:hypothetical protein
VRLGVIALAHYLPRQDSKARALVLSPAHQMRPPSVGVKSAPHLASSRSPAPPQWPTCTWAAGRECTRRFTRRRGALRCRAFSGPPRAANRERNLLFPPYLVFFVVVVRHFCMHTLADNHELSETKMQREAADGAPRDEARANTYVDQWFLGCVREVPRACVAGSSTVDVPPLSRPSRASP